MVAWLLAAGADLDVRDDNGCTALHLSCLRAEPTIAATCTRQLLAAGAEADGLTASGMVRLAPRASPLAPWSSLSHLRAVLTQRTGDLT